MHRVVRGAVGDDPRGLSWRATNPGMLLYLSTGRDRVRRSQGSEQLPGDVALECAHDLLRGAAFGPAACDIGAGGGIDSHADDRDRRERAIQTPIAAAVESVPHGVAR